MDKTVITIKTSDVKFGTALINFLANYDAVEKDSTVITLGSEENLKKPIDIPDLGWYDETDEEYDAYDSQDVNG
jgi:hypothetical protein